jgi:RNA polymerase sigma-B factor
VTSVKKAPQSTQRKLRAMSRLNRRGPISPAPRCKARRVTVFGASRTKEIPMLRPSTHTPAVAFPQSADDQDQRAVELVVALAELPADDPDRPRLREQAIEAWLPMVRRLARRYAGRGEPLDDLLQIATIGLIKAVDRFEPDRGPGFVGYAIPTILGEIKRHFRDRTWSIKVSRRLQDMRTAINEANNVLAQTHRRAPTVADIAVHLGVTEEEVLEGLEGARAYRATSLSTPTGPDGGLELGQCLGSEDHGYELIETHIALGPAMDRLDERERRIITLRFFGNQTQCQIAEQFGVSQMHVSRLIAGALLKLRAHLDLDVH